jgi:hypothetical protein
MQRLAVDLGPQVGQPVEPILHGTEIESSPILEEIKQPALRHTTVPAVVAEGGQPRAGQAFTKLPETGPIQHNALFDHSYRFASHVSILPATGRQDRGEGN